jgi:ABC-type bacteriocin/lantibiotic exporter with double-glycine peptidase domain
LAEAPLERDGELSTDRATGELEWRAVRFAWAGQGAPVLDGLDLQVPAGDRIAIIGPSGSGKTTLARLLVRLCDPGDGGGVVTLDGVDVRRYRLGELRATIGLLPQVPHIAAGTLGDAIRLGNPSAAPAEVEEALRISGVDRWLRERPEGLSMPLTERALNLSAGQRQSVALARLILTNPKVVILDEPTSHMDDQMEAAVIAALADWLLNRTLVLISHRVQPLRLCHRAAILKGGRIVTMKFIEVR